MPELPEVESYRRKLAPLVSGQRIVGAHAVEANYAFLTPPDELCAHLQGARIEGIRRHGKYLLLDIAPDACMLIHLGMTGQVFAESLAEDFTPDNHVHLTLTLEQGERFFFRDPRKFGKLAWLPSRDPALEPRLAKLGPDALEMDAERLWLALKSRKAPVKAALLDQSVFAGIGNIYADEALFACGVRPGRASRRLTRAEVDHLAESLSAVLSRAVEAGGSSINDYLLPDGSIGYFQIQHAVYGRAGQPCRVCQTPIKRKQIAQRSSHYCPTCQR